MIRVKRALSVRRLGLSNAIEIGFISRSATRSALIANAIAQSYIDGQLRLKTAARDEASSHALERLTELQQKASGIDQQAQGSPVAMLELGEQARTRFRELQKKAESYWALYNTLLQRVFTESDPPAPSIGARVITPAEPPLERSWPQAMLVLAIAAAAGMAAGVGHGLLRQATNHVLTSLEDVRQSSRLERIAEVSKVPRKAWKLRQTQETLQTAYTKASASTYEATGKLAVWLQVGQSRRSGLTIAVVPVRSGAGASSIAAHLAALIAESGQKTVLVDANWRKPSLGQPTLKSTPDCKLSRAFTVIHLEQERLDVLVLRAAPPMSELNASLSIVSTLQNLRTEYDCVVVDFHSIAQASDLEACLPVTDEVIIVARSGRTSCQELRRCIRLITRQKFAALILNQV